MTPKQKMQACLACDSLEKKMFGALICKECGCLMPIKVFSPLSKCPLNKWSKQEISE